ncbi:MAG: RDD family protein [Clostridia bacterium]|nr:RDD family protein [Clostridia bacterium]
MDVRFKRIIAFVIDYITLFPILFIFVFLSTFLQTQSQSNLLRFLLFFNIIILAFGVFILRDVIFKGRSLGKRIFGLYVYDKNTLKQANVKQCFLRNIFFFLYFIDGIILLVSGQTIGDRVADTMVMSKKSFELYSEGIQKDSSIPKKNKIKIIVLIVAIFICFLIALEGLIQIALNAQKDSEEYKIAYSYFTESDTFKKLNVDESKINFNQYSKHTNSKDTTVIQTAKIEFVVNFRAFEVVCHKENDIWQVCDDCTQFE